MQSCWGCSPTVSSSVLQAACSRSGPNESHIDVAHLKRVIRGKSSVGCLHACRLTDFRFPRQTPWATLLETLVWQHGLCFRRPAIRHCQPQVTAVGREG